MDIKCLKNLAVLFHPYLVQHKIKIAPKYPTQICGISYVDYSATSKLFYSIQGWLQDHCYDFLNHLTQDKFIENLYHYNQVSLIEAREHSSSNPVKKDEYTDGQFLTTIHRIMNNLETSLSFRHSNKTLSSSRYSALHHNTRSYTQSVNPLDLDVDSVDNVDLNLNELENFFIFYRSYVDV